MMVRYQRTARIARGRAQEALAWIKEGTEYLNVKHKATNPVHAWQQRYGPLGVVVWTWDFDSVGALDSHLQKVIADQEFSAMQRKNAENFMEGSIVDQILVMRQ